MKKRILLGVLVGILAAIGQALYVPKAPNCQPASAVYAVATSGNNIFAKASLSGKEMYQLDWATLHWTELPLDTSLHFEKNPHLWSFLDDKRVVTLDAITPYQVQVGGQNLNFCLPEK